MERPARVVDMAMVGSVSARHVRRRAFVQLGSGIWSVQFAVAQLII